MKIQLTQKELNSAIMNQHGVPPGKYKIKMSTENSGSSEARHTFTFIKIGDIDSPDEEAEDLI